MSTNITGTVRKLTDGARIGALEEDMRAIKDTVADHSYQLTSIKEDTSSILSVVAPVTRAGSIVRRYGPRTLVFGAGVMSALGFTNEKLYMFMRAFFGL